MSWYARIKGKQTHNAGTAYKHKLGDFPTLNKLLTRVYCFEFLMCGKDGIVGLRYLEPGNSVSKVFFILSITSISTLKSLSERPLPPFSNVNKELFMTRENGET